MAFLESSSSSFLCRQTMADIVSELHCVLCIVLWFMGLCVAAADTELYLRLSLNMVTCLSWFVLKPT